MEPLVSTQNRSLAVLRREDGVAAVEMAIVLPFFLILIACTLILGRALLNYQIACRASYDAARYLSSVSAMDIKNPAKIGAHVDLAKAIAAEEMGSAMSSGPYPPVITILCGGFACSGYATPLTISVGVQMAIIDDVLPMFSTDFIGGGLITLSASATMPYVGN